MADEDEALVAALAQVGQGAVQIGEAVLQVLVGGTAEGGEVAGSGDPVVAAGVDAKAMVAALGQGLGEDGEWREVEGS